VERVGWNVLQALGDVLIASQSGDIVDLDDLDFDEWESWDIYTLRTACRLLHEARVGMMRGQGPSGEGAQDAFDSAERELEQMLADVERAIEEKEKV
jgi:hypothetical protein